LGWTAIGVEHIEWKAEGSRAHLTWLERRGIRGHACSGCGRRTWRVRDSKPWIWEDLPWAAGQERSKLRPCWVRGRSTHAPGLGAQPARKSSRRDSRPYGGAGDAVREVEDEAERARLRDLADAVYPPYAEYQSRTTRKIPVFVAEPEP